MIPKRRAFFSFRFSPHGVGLLLLGIGFTLVEAEPTRQASARSNSRKQDSLLHDMVHGSSAAASMEKHRRWRKSLPRCGQGNPWRGEDWPDTGGVERVRGVLYPGRWMCTLMACNSKCCNFCGSELEFVPKAEADRKGAGGKGMPILLAGESRTMRYSGMDCAVDSIDRQPLLHVVVSGTVDDTRERMIVGAKLCVLDREPE